MTYIGLGISVFVDEGGCFRQRRPSPREPVDRLGTGTCSEDQERPGVGVMLAYPITLEDDDGTLLATSPDFPELTTFGDDREEAVARAVHALEEAIAARIHLRKDIPEPSRGETYAVLPTLTTVKVMLYQGMKEQGIGQGGACPTPWVAHAAG